MDIPRVRKRIIVCCDGTWYADDNGGNNLPSNVARMSRVLKKVGVVEQGEDKDQHRPQVVYYQSGVGTGKLRLIDKVWQGAFGDGLNENVKRAYNFLVNNYAPGDDILLFGFSRGVFTARAVAGLVCHAGLLKPHSTQLFRRMYEAYKSKKLGTKNQPAEELAETEWANTPYKSPYETEEEAALRVNRKTNWQVYKAHSDQNVPIKVVGVWDTVGSLGLPENVFPIFQHLTGAAERYKFYNTGLHSKIKYAFHAMALDEHRSAFSPTLYTTGEGRDDNGIDEITFAWMCDLVKPYLTFDRDAINRIIPSKTEMPPIEGKTLLSLSKP